MNKIISFFTAIILLPVTVRAKAPTGFSLSADFVSSYVWRGTYCAGTSIQPAMGFEAGGFFIEAWGSVDVGGQGLKEVDLSTGYSFGKFSIGLSDYWWNNEFAHDYFRFKKDFSSHILEVNLDYEFVSGFHLSWNTMIAGAQDKYVNDSGKTRRAFSTYIEAGYSFDIGSVELTAAIGCSPWKSDVMYTGNYEYGTDGFAVNNISLSATKSITVTDRFSLPVFGKLVFNPSTEDVFFVFGISF
jgi:hypothetical protein